MKGGLLALATLIVSMPAQAQLRSTGSPDFGGGISGVLDMGPFERIYSGRQVPLTDGKNDKYVPDCRHHGCLQVENYTNLELIGIYIDKGTASMDSPSDQNNLFGYSSYSIPPYSGIRTERRWACKRRVWVKFRSEERGGPPLILYLPDADFCASERQSETRTTIFRFGNHAAATTARPISYSR